MLRLGVGVTRGRTTVIKEAMKMLRCSGTIAAWKEQGDQGDQGRVTGIVSHTKALKGFSEMVLPPNQACLARNSWAPSSLVSSTPQRSFPGCHGSPPKGLWLCGSLGLGYLWDSLAVIGHGLSLLPLLRRKFQGTLTLSGPVFLPDF